ncbi:MAG: DUF2330 domain-containing protein [Gemmatimonadaceae bacterium]|nr:DUF2330 domain-containing protein [Gemmatimonadaceae bacterium]
MELSEIQALFMAGEDSTTVHLRGYFDGPLREFVWLVPVPAGSKIELSHKDIFQRLDQTTRPRFHLFHEDEVTPELLEEKTGFVPEFPELTYENEHSERCDYLADLLFSPFATTPHIPCPIRVCETVRLGDLREWETQAVTIIPARSHAGIADWVMERGYLPGPMNGEVVQSYLDEGHSILAVEVGPPANLSHLRLVNRIQPLAFTYGGDRIAVPLKSATTEGADRHRLTVWIAADSRAIPENYLHVHPNKARLNWMDAYGGGGSPRDFYRVLSDAVAEAGDPAFGTQQAMEGSAPAGWEEPPADLDSLRHPESLDAFMTDLWHGGILPQTPSGAPDSEFDLRLLQLLRKHIPIPQSVLEAIRKDYSGREERFHGYAESRFYSFPNEYEDHYENEWFDFSGFVDDWAVWIREPKARAHGALAGRPYLTRLTTFYFGDAETVDPQFGFNPDLGQVNDRPSYGKVGFECTEGEKGFWEDWSLMSVVGLEGGERLRFGLGGDYKWRILRYGTSEIPPAASDGIERLSASGSPVLVPGRHITSTVVEGTIPDGKYHTVQFARMVSSRRPRYTWSTTANQAGHFQAIISSGDPAGVQGLYQVRVRNRDGETLDVWYDIPLERNRRQVLELVPGESARVAAVERLDAAILEAADFDGDGTVGFGDFFLFAEAFGGSDPRFDLDGSGTVDLDDFLLFADHFGQPARGKLLALAREMIGLPDTPQLRNAPNPFNSRTVISWFQLSPGPVRLELYNALGQRVRILVDEVQAAGRHEVSWNARDQAGAQVASGVYLSRLHYPGGVETRRLLYLK